MKVGALEGVGHLRRGTLLPSAGHIPELWSGLLVSLLSQVPSESPAPAQEMLESKIHQVRKPDLNKSPTSMPNSVGVCQAAREQGQKPRSGTQGKHPGSSCTCSSFSAGQVFLL